MATRTLEAARAGDEKTLELKTGEAREKCGLDVFSEGDLWCREQKRRSTLPDLVPHGEVLRRGKRGAPLWAARVLDRRASELHLHLHLHLGQLHPSCCGCCSAAVLPNASMAARVRSKPRLGARGGGHAQVRLQGTSSDAAWLARLARVAKHRTCPGQMSSTPGPHCPRLSNPHTPANSHSTPAALAGQTHALNLLQSTSVFSLVCRLCRCRSLIDCSVCQAGQGGKRDRHSSKCAAAVE